MKIPARRLAPKRTLPPSPPTEVAASQSPWGIYRGLTAGVTSLHHGWAVGAVQQWLWRPLARLPALNLGSRWVGGTRSAVVQSVHSTILSVVALLPCYWWVCNAIAISLANVLLQLRWSAIRRAAI
jgi:hypothetical protein